jgi:DNA topoisomerase-1
MNIRVFRELGTDPDSGRPIQIVEGPFGKVLQLGEWTDHAPFPRWVHICGLKNVEPETLSFDKAIEILNLPRRLGQHPDDGLDVSAAIGNHGPYVQHGTRKKTFRQHFDVLTISLEEAVAYLKIRGTP